jgi:hypothetical protein
LKSEIDRLRILFDQNLDLENCTDTEVIECLKEKLDIVHERIEEEKGIKKVQKVTDLRSRLEIIE